MTACVASMCAVRVPVHAYEFRATIFQRMFTLSGHALPGAKWLLVQGLFAVTAASGA
jgi:hypothetical protein